MGVERLDMVLQRCAVSRQRNERMRSLTLSSAASSLRTNFARCSIDLALEHHSAFTRVVAAGEYGTAGALLRPLLEASTTGYWFVYAASCDEIRKLHTTSVDTPEVDIPDLQAMLRALTPIFPPIARISADLKRGGRAKWLHKYTHGGTPQLTRRLAVGWSDGEALRMLMQADMFATLSVLLENVIDPREELARFGFGTRDELTLEGQMYFGMERVGYQPHSLPAAPLLADGCGPAFC